ncbi:hypothetical protein D9M71_562900 [compost metagenome]
MGVDRMLIAFMVVAPHGIEQVQARKHLARLAGEEVQQVELTWGEVQALAVQRRLACQRVDEQTAGTQAARIHFQVTSHRLDPAQQRLDPGHQFKHRERLGQVVVGAQFQAEDAVHFTGAGAGDDDRCVVRHGPGPAANFQAVDARQHQVENQGVPVTLFQQFQGSVAIAFVHHVQLLVTQVQGDQVGDVLIVLDHQDAFGLIHGLSILLSAW